MLDAARMKDGIAKLIKDHGAHNLSAKTVREKLEEELEMEPGSLKHEKARITQTIDEVLRDYPSESIYIIEPLCPVASLRIRATCSRIGPALEPQMMTAGTMGTAVTRSGPIGLLMTSPRATKRGWAAVRKLTRKPMRASRKGAIGPGSLNAKDLHPRGKTHRRRQRLCAPAPVARLQIVARLARAMGQRRRQCASRRAQRPRHWPVTPRCFEACFDDAPLCERTGPRRTSTRCFTRPRG
mmetsp:Transcript_11/g.60  ORF Transcript_11/g.60 Transcript_11/m.60 type:complete len:240 (+) Transcript_11:48-767(+)